MDWQAKYQLMAQAVLDGEEECSAELAQQLLDAGGDPLEALNTGFLRGIREAGELYEKGDYYLPELVASAEAMNQAMAILQEALVSAAGGAGGKGKVVLATVAGDIHDIGKTIVGALFTANGFQVVDLGAAVEDEAIIQAVIKEEPELLALSALLTTTMAHQETVIKGLQDRGLRDKVKVLVGGAPVSQDWAKRIDADGYGDNAMEAVRVGQELIS